MAAIGSMGHAEDDSGGHSAATLEAGIEGGIAY
jgi:hypothetical protein